MDTSDLQLTMSGRVRTSVEIVSLFLPFYLFISIALEGVYIAWGAELTRGRLTLVKMNQPCAVLVPYQNLNSHWHYTVYSI
jgi:hypothetical protein